MQSSRILLLAKTFVMVYTLGNDQAADMLQNSIILLLVLELISKEDADEALQDISEGKKQESTEFHFKLSREEVDDTVQELRKLAEKPAMTKQGDVWMLGMHRLVCGDSTLPETYEKLMEGKKANLVVTDPPYNVNYEGSAGKIQNDNLEDDKFYNFLFAAFVNMEQNMERDASIYVFHADTEGLNFRRAFKAAGFYLSGTCIWKKQSLVLGRSPYQWQHEPILFGWKLGGKHMWYSDRKQSTIWEYDRPKKNDMHPTMKPVELVAYPIRNSSMSNCIVLDPFGGSGSTMIACEQTGRICRTIELDEKYADVIVHRYMEFVGSAEDVYVIRDGKKIKYSELMKEGDTHDAVDLP